MRLDLLDRWLLKELLGPLLFFIALFTLLLLTGGVMFELVRQMVDKNLPITDRGSGAVVQHSALVGLSLCRLER